MAVALASRIRALWLVCLLALTPAGPVGLTLPGHVPGEGAHAATIHHDASDHGIAPGALGDPGLERHCLYCVSASSVRFGRDAADTRVHAPVSTPVDWPERKDDALRTRLRHALPARAPPPSV